ncbi:MAG: hypothetical protein ACI8YQ_002791 [Polaribacter sp.]|jgi:hypothetical protein
MTVSRLMTTAVAILCLCHFSILYATVSYESVGEGAFPKLCFTDFIPSSKHFVELDYFDGRTMNINSVHLEWVTIREDKNRGFEIQRSVDGDAFQSIGFIEPFGDGSSNRSQRYHFIDDKLPGGKYYYRLKQMGFKEIVSYSEVLPILIQDFKDNFLAYPTSTGHGDFYIFSTQWRKAGERLSYELANLKGEVLHNSDFTSDAAFLLSLRNYPVGAYYVLVKNEALEVIGQLRVRHEMDVVSNLKMR